MKKLNELINIDFKMICVMIENNQTQQAFARLYNKQFLLPRLELEEQIMIKKRNDIIREVYARTDKDSKYRIKLEQYSLLRF